MNTFQLVIAYGGKEFAIDVPRPSSATVLALVQTALKQHGLSLPSRHSVVRFEERVLFLQEILSQAIPDVEGRDMVLLLLSTEEEESGSQLVDLQEAATSGVEVISAHEDSSGILLAESASGIEALAAPPGPDEVVTTEDVSDEDIESALHAPSDGDTTGMSSGSLVSALLEEEPATAAVGEESSSGVDLGRDQPEDLLSEAAAEEAAAEALTEEAAEETVDFGAPGEDDALAALGGEFPGEAGEEAAVAEGEAAEAEEEAEEEKPLLVRRAKARQQMERKATVRYYSQMNPQRTYPLLVVFSKEALQAIRQENVEQRTTGPLRVARGSYVDIEPVLPGCDCYPARQQVRITTDTVTASFWVVPHVFGPVMGAHVRLRQGNRILAEIPLDIRVVNRALTAIMGLASLVLPLGVAVARHYKLDFVSQLEAGFVTYANIAHWVLTRVSPEILTVCLLAGTGLSYLWLRPRKKDLFWDLSSRSPPALSLWSRLRQRLLLACRKAARVAVFGALLGLALGAVVLTVVAMALSRKQALSQASLILVGLMGVGAVAGALGGAIAGTLDEEAE